jgi:hypothetical protein
MHDGNHHNLASLRVDPVDNDVGPFEEFARADDETGSTHMGQFRRFQPHHFRFDAGDQCCRGRGIVLGDPGPDTIKIVGRSRVERDCASSQAPEDLGGRDCRPRIGKAAADVRCLGVGETQAAAVLLLHEGDDLRDVGLPLGRRRQNAVSRADGMRRR